MTTLLDLMHAPPLITPVQPMGDVLRGPADVTLRWQPEPRKLYLYAEIELHQHEKGWMWSTSWGTSGGGSRYKVGEKWGKFAATRDDALHHARAELKRLIKNRHGHGDDRNVKRIIAWADSLQ